MFYDFIYLAKGFRIRPKVRSTLSESNVNDATKQFETDILTLAKQSILTKEIIVRRDDKPWYDSEIRKFSRIRDRLKSTAKKSNNPVHWQRYKTMRNKVTLKL